MFAFKGTLKLSILQQEFVLENVYFRGIFVQFPQFSSHIRVVRSGNFIIIGSYANINALVVDNNILDNLLSNDKLNISLIRESQTTITNTLETPAQKTLPSRRKSSSITEIENYISKKHDELISLVPFKTTNVIGNQRNNKI